MHIIALWCIRSVSGKFLDFVSSSFEDAEIQEMLTEKDASGEIPLETSRRNTDLGTFQLYKQFYRLKFYRNKDKS